jgi:hypothetical protein
MAEDHAYVRSFVQSGNALLEPTVDQVTVAIDELDDGDLRLVFHQPGKALIPRPGRTERPCRIELDHAATNRSGVCDTPVHRAGIDIHHRPRASQRSPQTALQTISFVSPDSDNRNVLAWIGHHGS